MLKERTTGPAEMIGMIAALIILFITFRSVYAAILPLGVAVLGLVTGLSLVGLLGGGDRHPLGRSPARHDDRSRRRDRLRPVHPQPAPRPPQGRQDDTESIGRTNATAGQAVVVAGGTVVVAILGLQLAGIPFVAALGYSASFVVAIAVIVAVTLLPALLGFAGPRVLAKSNRQAAAQASAKVTSGEALEVSEGPSGWVRWAHWVAFHRGVRRSRDTCAARAGDPGARHAPRPG